MRFLILLVALLTSLLAVAQTPCENLDKLLKEGDLEKAEKAVLEIKNSDCNALIGEFYLRKGRNDNAQEYFEKALSVADKNSLDQASALNSLGLVFWNRGISGKAQEYIQRAFGIRKQILGEHHEKVAASLNDLGLVVSSENADDALDYYENALDIYDSINADDKKIAQIKTNIGVAYQKIELYGDAQANFDEALKIWERIYPEGHPNQGFLLLNLGQTNQLLGKSDAALKYYERALSVFQKYYGKKHPDVARANRFIGDIYNIDGQYDKALSHYQEALIANAMNFKSNDISANPETTDYINANVLLNSLYYKSQALQGKFYNQSLKFKDLRLSLKTLQACDSLIDKTRQLRTNESDKIALGAIASQVYESGVRLCHSMSNEAVKKGQYLELSFYFAEKSKSAVLLEAISDASAKSFANIPSKEIEKEKEYKAEITFLEQKTGGNNNEESINDDRNRLLDLKNEYSSFVKKLESAYPEYYNLKYNVSIPSVSNLQEKLQETQTLISYFLDDTNTRVYIFEINKNKFNVYNVPQTENLNRYLFGFRNSIYFKEENIFDLTANGLYKILFPKKMANNATNLVIIPAGRLGTIPFEAFITSGKKKLGYTQKPYLINDYGISYEYSSTLFYNKKKKQSTGNTALLCAPVNFDQFADLPATEIEVNEISEILKKKSIKTSIFFKKQANESLLKATDMQSYRYIHLATHGVVDESNPELSQILLNPGSKDDGNLYSGEIYNLKINADLVTLSACETGLGKISEGEGIIGLSRALIYSGANNIMVSLWSVADKSTSDLMIDFYNDVDRTTFSGALKTAKLKMIKNKESSAPYYWAPFILVGR